MTTTLSEHQQSRSIPWKDVLYPRLRDPQHAWEYLQTATEDAIPGEVAQAISQVIEANKDLPFVAYLVVCPFSQYLSETDIDTITDTLKNSISPEAQEFLSELYWWLETLKTKLSKGIKIVELQASGNLPEELMTQDGYQEWAQVA